MLFAKVMLDWASPCCIYENAKAISEAIGRAIIKPASSGFLFDSHDAYAITIDAVKIFSIVSICSLLPI